MRLVLLGGFALHDPAGREIAIASQGAGAARVLGGAFRAAVGRERLIGILWADHAQERARHSLRQALSELGREVPPLIVGSGDALALDPDACTVDVAAFRQLAQIDRSAGRTRPPQCGAAAVPGVPRRLYRGWFELADVSCALSDLRMQVKIGADGASPRQLRELVEWSDAHSMVGCTVRAGAQTGLEIEVV